MVLKMFKMLQIPLSCKRYTHHSEDAKIKMALPHLTLDNTNVSTVENIYFQNNELLFVFFFFVFFCLGKTKRTSRIFRKSSCTTATEASVLVQSVHLSLSSAIKPPSRRSGSPCFAAFFPSFVPSSHTSLFKQRLRTGCGRARLFVIES